MYLDHFGLSEPPFRITPHTDFFFSGAKRGATLDALLYAITHDEGIVKVSGEVGSGKTMLCRVLMERLPSNVSIVYLANPSLSRDDILYAIADELQLRLPEQARPSTLIRALYDQLINLYGQGRRVVILIDEAHAMPSETLEEVRLLSNLESSRHKLLQLVLFGQPELNDVLGRPDMRQLKERITHNFQLEPLVRDDVAEYLEFRMRAAGYRGPNVFSPQATRLIAEASEGLTRRINILADKSLLAAFSDATHQITAKQVRAAIRDSEFSANVKTNITHPVHLGAVTKSALLMAGGAAIGILAALLLLDPTQAPSPAAHPAAAPTPTISSPAIAAAAPIPIASAIPPAASPTTTKSATDRYLEAGRVWLEQADDERWFIQLLAADADEQSRVESFARKLPSAQLDDAKIKIYLSDLSGKMRYGIIYGDYQSATEAKAQIRRFPAWLQTQRPFPRPVRQLR
ncbi:MAG: AAA family ATPase [Rhodocyclaceae bacterium]|nr:AAA family ATPase [Rhodocyclaceae bacterium]